MASAIGPFQRNMAQTPVGSAAPETELLSVESFCRFGNFSSVRSGKASGTALAFGVTRRRLTRGAVTQKVKVILKTGGHMTKSSAEIAMFIFMTFGMIAWAGGLWLLFA
jgi:hypothetical protein